MKKRLLLMPIIGIWICILNSFSAAQNATENLIEKVDLKFSLTGEPTPEKVGFGNRRSYWKLYYELVLTDSLRLEKIGRCKRTEEYKLSCPLDTAGKFDKEIRRVSSRIAKGKFKKKGLLLELNREVVIPIKLSREVIDIFNKAVNSDDNPTFIFFVKTKAFTKIVSKSKFGNKYSTTFKFKNNFSTSMVRPLKAYHRDRTFKLFWNVRSFGMSFGIYRDEDCIVRGFRPFKF